MLVVIENRGVSWAAFAAAGLGIIAIAGEGFIAGVTLLSGSLFGFYDVAGVVLGTAALVLVWKWPGPAAALWLAEDVMLYSGHLLVSVACLPMLFFPLAASALAGWSWLKSRPGQR